MTLQNFENLLCCRNKYIQCKNCFLNYSELSHKTLISFSSRLDYQEIFLLETQYGKGFHLDLLGTKVEASSR